MVSACPTESDPRPKVGKFVSDPSTRSISGLREEGLGTLMDIVREEVRRQHPDISIVDVDRDFLMSRKVLFLRDLTACFSEFASGGPYALFITEDMQILNWQSALSALPSDVMVFYGSLACRQVPLCVKVK